MSDGRMISRRQVLRKVAVLGAGLAFAGPVLAACGPTPTPKVVKETVVVKEVVEKPVEKVVTKIVAGTPVKEVVKETVVVEKPVEKVVTKEVVKEVTVAPAAKKPVTLRVHTRQGADLDVFWTEKQKLFLDRYPHVTIKLEVVPGGVEPYAAKMLAVFAANQVGDVIWSASRAGFSRQFMSLGMMRPLDDLMKSEGFDLGLYYPNCIAEVTYEGKVMALPYISEPGNLGIANNLNLMKQRGAKPLTWDSTLDDLVKTAVACQFDENKDGKIDHFGWGVSRTYFAMVAYFRSFGGDLLSPDGKKCVMYSPEVKATVKWHHDLIYKHKGSLTPAEVEESTDQMFFAGRLGMAQYWPFAVLSWRVTIKDKFQSSFTVNPPGPKGRGSLLNQHMMSVAAASKSVEEAWAYVKWACSRELVKIGCLEGKRGPVGMASIYHDPDILAKIPEWEEWARIMDNVGPNYIAANLRGREMEDAFNNGIQEIWLNKIGVDEGVSKVAKAVQDVLDKPPLKVE